MVRHLTLSMRMAAAISDNSSNTGLRPITADLLALRTGPRKAHKAIARGVNLAPRREPTRPFYAPI